MMTSEAEQRRRTLRGPSFLVCFLVLIFSGAVMALTGDELRAWVSFVGAAVLSGIRAISEETPE